MPPELQQIFEAADSLKYITGSGAAVLIVFMLKGSIGRFVDSIVNRRKNGDSLTLKTIKEMKNNDLHEIASVLKALSKTLDRIDRHTEDTKECVTWIKARMNGDRSH